MQALQWQLIAKRCCDLMKIDSPSGFTAEVSNYIDALLREAGYAPRRTVKGAVYLDLPGEDGEAPRRMVTAHVDTIGGMVSEVLPNGRLRLVNIGGWAYNTIEAANCRIHTADGRIYPGTAMPDKASMHIYSDEIALAPRNYNSVSIRLDEKVENAGEVGALGIRTGDFVAFETNTVLLENGYIKSRHLDNKMNAAIVLELLLQLKKEGGSLPHATRFLFSVFEELGHGISEAPEGLCEVIGLDIGTVGDGRSSREDRVTIVARDSRTPYPFPLRCRLCELAEKQQIPYVLDVHIRYGSDGSLAAIAGYPFTFSCFGPGVEATHHYERTHRDGCMAAAALLQAYLLSPCESF